MKLYRDYGDFQMIRVSEKEIQDRGDIMKNDLIKFGNSYYKVWGTCDDGHGNKIVFINHPVTVHEYNWKNS